MVILNRLPHLATGIWFARKFISSQKVDNGSGTIVIEKVNDPTDDAVSSQDKAPVAPMNFDPAGPRTSPLLCLPRELRDHILELMFFGSELSELCKCHRPNPFQREKYGVLLTNHQLYKESVDVISRGAVLQLAIFLQVVGNGAVVALDVSPYWTWRMGSLWEASEKRVSPSWQPTVLELLRHWPRLAMIRHVQVRVPRTPFHMQERELLGDENFEQPFDRIRLKGCTDVAELLMELPVVETVIVSTSVQPAAQLQEFAKPLREVCKTKGAELLIEVHGRCQIYEI